MLLTAMGIAVIVLGLICWIGQTLVAICLGVAVKLGVGEPENEIDRLMNLFERFSQEIPDILLTWILPASSLMMLLGMDHWPILAQAGGGVYLYFPAVFGITRVVLQNDAEF